MYKSMNNSYVAAINSLSKKISEKEVELAKYSIIIKKYIKKSKKRILKSMQKTKLFFLKICFPNVLF